jgi:hypothetical protein
MSRTKNWARVEKEIAAEKAAALGRAGERLEAALGEVAALAVRLDVVDDLAERARLGEAYERAWRHAHSARLALLIQREALGLRQHRLVDQAFPTPPRRPTPRA